MTFQKFGTPVQQEAAFEIEKKKKPKLKRILQRKLLKRLKRKPLLISGIIH